MKTFSKTRIVTRNFVSDWLQGIRSLFGKRMTSYEAMTEEAIKDIIKEIESNGKIRWYRMNLQDVGDGILVNIYGEYK